MSATYLYRDCWLTLDEAAAMIGCTPATVRKRVCGHMMLDDWNRSDAVSLTHDGQTRSVTEWAAITGLSRATIYTRLFNGWSPDRALSTPPAQSGRGAPRARNRRIIKRISRTVKVMALARRGITATTIVPTTITGGYVQTFTLPIGTGGRPHETHFEGAA